MAVILFRNLLLVAPISFACFGQVRWIAVKEGLGRVVAVDYRKSVVILDLHQLEAVNDLPEVVSLCKVVGY